MHCPYCHQEHPDTARFCPVTGQTLEPAPNKAQCPHCGQALQTGVRFCPACGHPLDGEQILFPAKRRFFAVLAVFGFLLMLVGIWLTFQTLAPKLSVAQENIPSGGELTGQKVTEAFPTPDLVAQISSATSEPSPTQTSFPTLPPTSTPTPTATFTPSPSATPTLTPTPAMTNPADGAVLIFIPAGEFTMGSNPNSDPYFWGAEGPEHRVYLDDYWIYRTEVTNAMYQQCVDAQKCPLPQWPRSATRDEYYPNPQFANYPVIFVSYVHAQSYCKWAGVGLPTEAQWEKAARGDDRRLFPWGDTPPTSGLINFGNQDTAEVGSFPGDISPYGVLDMAGNVWEWVFDYFQPAFYSASPDENPLGPASGTRRVIRGGAFFGDAGAVRTVVRASENPNSTFEAVGFRCAVEVLP